jgi:hypothetical protein
MRFIPLYLTLAFSVLPSFLLAQKERKYYAIDRKSYTKEMELNGQVISYLGLNVNTPTGTGDWKKPTVLE